MDEAVPKTPLPIASAAAAPILSYQSTIPGSAVTVGLYSNAVEAALPSADLAAEGIPNHVLNANVNALGIHFASFTAIELQVHESDAARAREILDRINADDLEPAPVPAGPPLDENGEWIPALAAGAFENVRGMRDAQTILASAGIAAFPPALVRRGESPPGEGKRFILRVREADLGRAQKLLSESDEVDDEDARCPKCGSWRTYPHSQFFSKLLGFLSLGPRPQELTDCLACGYRGPTAQFAPTQNR